MAAAAFLTASGAFPAKACVDVAIVLAVDGSSSITDDEYDFQKSAIANAFRDASVISALKAAGIVAVSAVFWGDGEFATQKLDWFIMMRGKGTEAFAQEVESNSRTVFGNTNIGSGIWTALDMLSDPGICAVKPIINLSGDGKETSSPKRRQRASLYQARLRAREMGVTINALVISNEEYDLRDYYASKVILGADAFVMDVENFADYSAALRSKLIRELSQNATAASSYDPRL